MVGVSKIEAQLDELFVVVMTTIWFLFISFTCGISYGWDNNKFPIKEGQKAWVLSDDTPFTNEPSYVSESIMLINRGQAVKILEISGEWVRVQVLHNEPGWKYDGKKWVEANERIDRTTEGWNNEESSFKNKATKAYRQAYRDKGI